MSFVLFMANLQIHSCVTENYLFASIFFATVMDRYLRSNAPLNWIERGLIPVGIVSYSLYLWHLPVFYFVYDLLAKLSIPYSAWRFTLLDLPVSVIILGVVSAVSWHFVEVGVPRWLKKYKLVPHVGRALPEIATVEVHTPLSEKSA